MSLDASDLAAPGAAAILARARLADDVEARRLHAAVDDFFLPDDARLDDQTRAALGASVARSVEGVVREIATFVQRATGRVIVGEVLPRLLDSGLLRDAPLMADLIGGVRQDLLAEALRRTIAPTDQSNLLARLAECPDGVVATAAAALLTAENRARHGRRELTYAVHQRLVWWVAAALREAAGEGVAIERALADGAARSIAANAAADRLDAAAMRLAVAIDPRPAELGDLLSGALADARPTLFFALVAHAASLDFADARSIALDPDGDRLWLVLRAQGLDRAEIAQIGLMLSQADHRRDVEAFADLLDPIAAVESDAAAAALAPMRLHPEFRAALRALARARA
jgi:hypothetical protein